MRFTCWCGHTAQGMITRHCKNCGWHTKVQQGRCAGCGERVVMSQTLEVVTDRVVA